MLPTIRVSCRSSPALAPPLAPTSSMRRSIRPTDGLALDTFFVSRGFERDEDELRRADRIALAIERTLRGEIRLGELVAAKGGAAGERDTSLRRAAGSLDRQRTVEPIHGDRSVRPRPAGPALQHHHILSGLNLNIGSAHIATFGEKAADVFYVTDLTGAKINSASRKAAIRQKLLDGIQPSRRRRPSGRLGPPTAAVWQLDFCRLRPDIGRGSAATAGAPCQKCLIETSSGSHHARRQIARKRRAYG